MKKFRFLSLAVALALAVSMFAAVTVSASNEPAYVFDFYYEDDYQDYSITGVSGCDITWENNALKMVCDGSSVIGDMYFSVNDIATGDFDGEDYPYMAISLLNPTDAPEFEAHFGTNLHGISGSTVFHFDIDQNMTEFRTYIVNIPEQNVVSVNRINGPDGIAAQEGATGNTVPEMGEDGSFWEGTVTSLRIDGTYRGGRSGESVEGDSLYICWIAFFETKEAAESYAGPDHSEVRTPAPTPAPGEINTVPGGFFLFDHDDEMFDELFSGGKNQIGDYYFDSEKGCYCIEVFEGNDPYIELNINNLLLLDYIEPISADDYKVIQICARVDIVQGNRTGTIYYSTDLHTGYGESQTMNYSYAKSDDPQIVNIDFTKVKTWEGDVANTRLDMFGSCAEDTTMDLYYIAFFDNLDSAKAFAAMYAEQGAAAFPAAPTPAPTKEPTPTTAPTATNVPATEPAAEDTAEPAATEAATDNGTNEGEGSKFPVVPVIIVCAVVLAAVIAGIVIAGSKKGKKNK